MADYTSQLKADLVEQFKGQPNITALMEVIGEQLQEVADFYQDLRTLRALTTAFGSQLDGAGDIVVLSRAEAAQMANIANPGEAITDEIYRKFLFYKVHKNTNICTYNDIIKSFKMFWDKELYYSEDPDEPATMFFNTDVLTPEDSPEKLLSAPIIKAAGVGIKITAATENPEMQTGVYVSAAMGRGMMVTTLPEYVPEYDFTARVHTGAAMQGSIMSTRLRILNNN